MKIKEYTFTKDIYEKLVISRVGSPAMPIEFPEAWGRLIIEEMIENKMLDFYLSNSSIIPDGTDSTQFIC